MPGEAAGFRSHIHIFLPPILRYIAYSTTYAAELRYIPHDISRLFIEYSQRYIVQKDDVLWMRKKLSQPEFWPYAMNGALPSMPLPAISWNTWLLRGGFADGAYARWRSLFELSIISEFICQNDEQVAKAFVDFVKTSEEKDYGWAKTAPCFASLKPKANVTFEMIRSQCTTIAGDWKKAYKESCQVVHASPLGTLGRMGSPNETELFLQGQVIMDWHPLQWIQLFR